MNATTTPGPLLEALGSVTFYAIKIKPLLPTYIHLLISAIFPIYAAAHASLRRPVSAAPPKKNKSRKHDGDEDESSDADSTLPIETLTTSDAVLFPVLAGVTLTGLYLVIKWLEDPSLLNQILGYYFSWVGIFFSFNFVKDALYFLRSWVFPTQYSWHGILYELDKTETQFIAKNALDSSKKADIKKSTWFGASYMGIRRIAHQGIKCVLTIRKSSTPVKLSLPLTWLDIMAGLSASAIAFHKTFGFTTPWYLTNLQGFAFCYGSLQFMSPGTSAVGSLLLALLFFYDIYMVFYTPMMVTVATKLEVPIKLLFPKNVDTGRQMAMLGLGDIVVPGIMIAFALRFDLYRHYAKMAKYTNVSSNDSDIEKEKEKDTRPVYTSARGFWAERTYVARKLWSPKLKGKAFPKPYFKATVAGYLLGMISTVVIMTVFDHAQPALLYLVPGVLLSFWGTALFKREVKLAWRFDEAEEEKEKEKKEAAEQEAKSEKDKKKDEEDDSKGKKETSSNNKKTADQKAVESGLKPIITFDIYLRGRSSESTSSSNEAKSSSSFETSTSEFSQTSELSNISIPSNEAAIGDESETSSPSTSSASSSSAEVVTREEALDDEGVDKSAGSVIVATANDEGGAQAVKRRRKA